MISLIQLVILIIIIKIVLGLGLGRMSHCSIETVMIAHRLGDFVVNPL